MLHFANGRTKCREAVSSEPYNVSFKKPKLDRIEVRPSCSRHCCNNRSVAGSKKFTMRGRPIGPSLQLAL